MILILNFFNYLHFVTLFCKFHYGSSGPPYLRAILKLLLLFDKQNLQLLLCLSDSVAPDSKKTELNFR